MTIIQHSFSKTANKQVNNQMKVSYQIQRNYAKNTTDMVMYTLIVVIQIRTPRSMIYKIIQYIL